MCNFSLHFINQVIKIHFSEHFVHIFMHFFTNPFGFHFVLINFTTMHMALEQRSLGEFILPAHPFFFFNFLCLCMFMPVYSYNFLISPKFMQIIFYFINYNVYLSLLSLTKSHITYITVYLIFTSH